MTARCHYHLTTACHGELVASPRWEPGPGQIVMRVAHNGVCASDLPTWQAGPIDGPLRLGHEPTGTVEACGPGVELAVGSWVTGRILDSYATDALADVRDLVHVPDGLDPSQTIGEPLGCVVDGLSRVPVNVGDRVAVIGLGYMGRIAAQLVTRSAASTVVGVDVRDEALAAAIADGLDAGYRPDELPSRLLATGDRPAAINGVDLVIEATGTQAGLDLATTMARVHGTIAILGYHQSDRRVDMQVWNWKALDIINAHVRDRDRLRESTRRGLELAAAGHLDLSSMITHRFPLEHIDDAFIALRDKPTGFVKALIDLG